MTTDRPWSEIGIDVSDQISIKQALIQADLDFYVAVKQGYFKEKKAVISAENYFYIVRTDIPRVLGQCKSRFKPLQNDVLVEIAQPLISSGKVSLDTIGTFGEGEKVWILLRLNEFRSDELGLDHYLLLMNGHDGETSIQVGIIPFRLSCANMLPKVGKYMIKFKHTENAEEMLQFFNKEIESRLNETNDMVQDFIKLARKPVKNTNELNKYFRIVMGFATAGELPTRSKNIVAHLFHLFRTGRGNKGETWWDAFNAVTEYLNYTAGRNQTTRLNSLWFGKGDQVSNKALELANDAL
jgi:phage/plasmid-like protein (TIGR03299 family)